MNFNSYIISETEIAKTLPLNFPPPYSSKGLRRFLKKGCFKKGAFTLAETLITLTIVGVIAALTVPTLISNYQKHTYVTRLKKVYSELQNAVKMIPINEGCPAGDYECAGFVGGIGEMRNQVALLAKQFKTISVNDSNAPACKSIQNYTSNFNFTSEDNICFATSGGYYGNEDLKLLVDINGAKGPNKIGRDIFAFKITRKELRGIPEGTVIPIGSQIYSIYTYGNSSSGYWKSYNACMTENANTPWLMQYCAGRVLEEDAMNY